MDDKEYIKTMEMYQANIGIAQSKGMNDDATRLYEEMTNVQIKYMTDFYESIIVDTPEKELVKELIDEAINNSETGQAKVVVPKELDLEKTGEIVWNEIGDMLLDILTYEEDGDNIIDVMFGGYYVPCWDGFRI